MDNESIVEESLAGIGRYGTYREYAFFDKVRRLLGNETTYLNFMKCIKLYSDDLLSGSDLISTLQPFTVKYPEITRDLREVFGVGALEVEPVSKQVIAARKQAVLDPNMDVDYASCRKHSASYRPLPDSYPQPTCSGRTQLCNEVLNDTWVSFPLWSEDTTFGESRMSAHQEFSYRCEDERFELEVVIEMVTSTVEGLEREMEKISRMSPDDARTYELDDRLGGSSEVLQRRAVQRIYGDKAKDMIEGVKRRPSVAVPIVVRRLRAKLAEWRAAKENYNKIWRDLSEKQYAKHLVTEATLFKHQEARSIRHKVLVNEAVTLYEENAAILASGRGADSAGLDTSTGARCARRLEYAYSDGAAVQDAQVLLVQGLCQISEGGGSGVGEASEEVGGVGRVLNEFLVKMFSTSAVSHSCSSAAYRINSAESAVNNTSCCCNTQIAVTPRRQRVMYVNSVWYVFWRLHHRLCERLSDIRNKAATLDPSLVAAFDTVNQKRVSLSLDKEKKSIYSHTLCMIAGLLDGSVELASFESTMRRVYGVHACSTFSVDRLVINAVKQLETVLSDDTSRAILNLFCLSSPQQNFLPFFPDDEVDQDFSDDFTQKSKDNRLQKDKDAGKNRKKKLKEKCEDLPEEEDLQEKEELKEMDTDLRDEEELNEKEKELKDNVGDLQENRKQMGEQAESLQERGGLKETNSDLQETKELKEKVEEMKVNKAEFEEKDGEMEVNEAILEFEDKDGEMDDNVNSKEQQEVREKEEEATDNVEELEEEMDISKQHGEEMRDELEEPVEELNDGESLIETDERIEREEVNDVEKPSKRKSYKHSCGDQSEVGMVNQEKVRLGRGDKMIEKSTRKVGVDNEVEAEHKLIDTCRPRVDVVSDETSYRRQVLELLEDEMCVKILLNSHPACHTTPHPTTMQMEVLQVDGGLTSDPDSQDVQRWSAYLDLYTDPLAEAEDIDLEAPSAPIYLHRCIKRVRGSSPNDDTADDSRLTKMIISDDLGCQFKVNSYKMTFTSGTTSFLYYRRCNSKEKANGRKKARERRRERQRRWHSAWVRQHVTTDTGRPMDRGAGVGKQRYRGGPSKHNPASNGERKK